MIQQQWLIPATKGLGFRLAQGQTLRVTDVEGEQVADLVAYRADDRSERLDPGVTMDVLQAIAVKPGDRIYSNKYKPLLAVVSDTVGRHDLNNPACRSEMYELTYGKTGHASCYDNLNEALAPFGIAAPDQHYSLNLFMNMIVEPNRSTRVERPLSKAGAHIELRAETDLIVAVSACPCADSACNGYRCTPIGVEIR